MKYLRFRVIAPSIAGLLALGLSACNGPGSASMDRELGRDSVIGVPGPVPGGSTSTGTGGACGSSDPDHICLALKYVVYAQNGQPSVSPDLARQNLAEINSIWGPCNLAFTIETYLPVNPADHGLSYGTASTGELDSARQAFVDDKTLLVVSTGAWTGSLGAGAANAWTTMPGGGTPGVVLEEPVAAYANIIAHELGHYLNLDHAGSSSNFMSAIMYDSSTQITASQCEAARSAAMYYWPAMLR